MENEQNKTRDYLLPLSIVIAAVLISGSWVYTTGLKNSDTGTAQIVQPSSDNEEDFPLKPIEAGDHIRGNPSAPVKIVEFSDLECPFCKTFHQTMMQAMDEYGKAGKVAWVYRHFPLDELHPVKARKAAVASECAAELGDNDKFWAYVDRYFEVTPSNNQIDLAELPKIAEAVGLNRSQFESCLGSDKYNQKIEENIKDAENTGARGTPYSILITKDGRKFPINGAQPYSEVKVLIEEGLK